MGACSSLTHQRLQYIKLCSKNGKMRSISDPIVFLNEHKTLRATYSNGKRQCTCKIIDITDNNIQITTTSSHKREAASRALQVLKVNYPQLVTNYDEKAFDYNKTKLVKEQSRQYQKLLDTKYTPKFDPISAINEFIQHNKHLILNYLFKFETIWYCECQLISAKDGTLLLVGKADGLSDKKATKKAAAKDLFDNLPNLKILHHI